MSPTEILQAKKRTKTRQELPLTDCWNVQALYASDQAWEHDFQKWGRPQKQPHWPEIENFKGKLGESSQTILKLFEIYFEIDRMLTKLYIYAHLKHDEDTGNDVYKQLYQKSMGILHALKEETAWIEPELLHLPEKTLASYLKDPILAKYKIHLEKMIRFKPHVLSAEQETLMALAGQALDSSSKTFGAFNNADIKFPKVRNQLGEELELTHGKYALYLRNQDRVLREEAFKTMHRSYFNFENSLCEMINGEVQSHLFSSKARRFSTCLEAALFPHQIDLKIYLNLIQTVKTHLPVFHRYMKLRKQILGVPELHLYDLHVPLVKDVEMHYSYDDAVDLVVKTVAPLGKEYQQILRKGLLEERWVDRYENMRKRSGAYSSGCYDSMPYILMNFQGTFNDMTTLAHEAGHSMHSFYSNKHQPYHYSHYPIFVAEVASTFNEELAFHHLMKQNLTKEQKVFLINQKLDDIRGTFFRQTMFAEFELKLHEWAETQVPLTPQLLKQHYFKLNQDYHGPDVFIDQEIEVEWARIPHFYYGFYVYQYATGLSAACALFQKVMQEKEPACKRYLEFLSSGSSAYPVELLQKAGVDMYQPQSILALINHFKHLVDELEILLKK